MLGPESLVVGVLILLGALVVVIAIWFFVTYNRLVAARNQLEAADAQVDVQLKRRHDLIPALVETVKGYATHERSTLDAVVTARSNAAGAGLSRSDRAAAEGQLAGSLSRLVALAEAYPDLKANQNFRALQTELATTEDRIAYARQFVNGAAQTLNNAVTSFPSTIVAAMTGFRRVDYFRTAEDQRDPVAIRF